MLLRALSKSLFNTDGHGASTTAPGSLLQCSTTPSVKKCFPMSSLNLLWRNFEPFLHLPSPAAHPRCQHCLRSPELCVGTQYFSASLAVGSSSQREHSQAPLGPAHRPTAVDVYLYARHCYHLPQPHGPWQAPTFPLPSYQTPTVPRWQSCRAGVLHIREGMQEAQPQHCSPAPWPRATISALRAPLRATGRSVVRVCVGTAAVTHQKRNSTCQLSS